MAEPRSAPGMATPSGAGAAAASAAAKPLSLPLAGAHLLALSAIAVAQPLLNLLGKNPAFFAAHGTTGLEVVPFAIGVLLVPPAVLLGIEALAALVDRRLALALHLVFVAALVAVIAVQALKRIEASRLAVTLVLAGVIGVAVAVAYWRLRPVRELATVLSAAPVLVLVLFLFADPVSDLVFGGAGDARAAAVHSRTPVVMVVLDEFPAIALQDAQGRIDATRYPHFAALARDADFFPHVSSPSDDTPAAVPAILTGQFPQTGRLPTLSGHPNNIFTALGADYGMHVAEQVTSMCPRRYCGEEHGSFLHRTRELVSDAGVVYAHLALPKSLEQRLPSISQGWSNFRNVDSAPRRTARSVLHELGGNGRPARFERWVAGIRDTARPTLNLIHQLLPHVPYQYLPSGQAYQVGGQEPLVGLNGEPGFPSAVATEHSQQRMLLQTGFTDLLVGSLMRRLRATGLYDRALLVIVADHGIAFDPGHNRRIVRPPNAGESIAPPILLKLPHQRRGRTIERHVRTIDVVPTIAQVLGVRLPYHADGRSLLDPAENPAQVAVHQRTGSVLRIPYARFRREQDAALARQIARFGDGPWSRLYRFGPHAELIGRTVASLATLPAGAAHATILQAADYRSVNPRSGYLPLHVLGHVSGGRPGAARDIAVAVNGRIAAVGRTFRLAGSAAEDFAVLIPDGALRAGANRVQVLEVSGSGGRLALRPLGATG